MKILMDLEGRQNQDRLEEEGWKNSAEEWEGPKEVSETLDCTG